MDFSLVILLYWLLLFFFRIVRLISPNLNYLVIAGAIMLYASVYFFFSFSSRDPLLITLSCHVSISVATVKITG